MGGLLVEADAGRVLFARVLRGAALAYLGRVAFLGSLNLVVYGSE
jgi:hypothetical protein